MYRLFTFIFKIAQRYKVVSIIALIIIIGTGIYFSSQIKLVEDISKIIPTSDKITNMNFVFKNSKFLDKVILNISLEDSTLDSDPDLLIEYAERITKILQDELIPSHIKEIKSTVDEDAMLGIYNLFYENLPVFLSDKDYIRLDSMITRKNIEASIDNAYKILMTPASFSLKEFLNKDPLSFTPIALEKLKELQIDDNFKLYDNYILTTDKKNLLLFITPAYPNETSINSELFEVLDKIILDLRKDHFIKVNAEYFGSSAVAVANANRIKKDITITVSIALLVLMVFISLFFKRKRILFIIFMPVAFGGIVSLSALFLLKTEVSAMSLGIGSVLLGISIDFSLHILSHFRSHGSVLGVLKDLSTPIIMSSLTTASAFFCLYFINSEALIDLGLFVAVSVLSAAFFSLLVLPHFLKNIKLKTNGDIYNNTWIDRISAYDYTKNKTIIIFIFILSIIFIYKSGNVGFESDMLKINYMSEKLVEAEINLNKISNITQKTVYLVATGNNLNTALDKSESLLQKIDSLKKSGIITKATGISHIFHSEVSQQQSIDKWNEYWTIEKRQQLKENIEIAKKKNKFSKSAFSKFQDFIDKDFKPLNISAAQGLRKLFLDDYIIETDDLTTVINLLKVKSDDEHIKELYSTFSENDELVWIFDKQMLTEEFVSGLKENFNTLITISLLVVFLILVIIFGRIELGIITFFPMVISWIWTIGLMGVFGIKFNIFNIIISTFIFGLGIDYSIFIMQGLLQNYKFGNKSLSSYKVSVLLSAFTTIVGIGVLIFAKHPALKSIALLSIIGILSVIIITFTVQPILLNWMIEFKKGKRRIPVTFTNFTISITTFILFLLGSVLMTILIPIFIIFPASKRNKKIVFHYCMMIFARFIVSVSVFSKKTIINDFHENFQKPSIIIVNHQSHIDLMLTIMLAPKIIVLTNDWVWKNAFYGFIIRYAEYYPISSGYEGAISKLKSKVEDGYSILIFPEGTRSETGRVRRFHKGAFYMADKLGLDILPVIIHGANNMMQKGEFFLKRGDITVKILKRISLSSNNYGVTYSQQAKNVVKEFRKEFEIVRKEVETPEYFRNLLINNFIYKGPVLEWYLRVKIRLEKNYNLFNDIIPKQCEIIDIGCGYGFLAFILGLVSSERKITGIDYDNDKIEVANNCAIKSSNVEFISADITELILSEADVFILNDILHYLPKDLQINTIKKCIKNLKSDGMIIIRDANSDLKKRHMVTKYTEFFSTKFGFNKTNYDKLSFISKNVIEDLVEEHSLKLEIINNTLFTSNLIYIIKHKR